LNLVRPQPYEGSVDITSFADLVNAIVEVEIVGRLFKNIDLWFVLRIVGLNMAPILPNVKDRRPASRAI
jgi:hypothetical protein